MNPLGMAISREGSKRIPGKNTKMFCGKPLLEWTLIQLTTSRHIHGYWLVTDSEEHAKLAEGYGFHIEWQPKDEIDKAEAEGKLGGPYAMRRGIQAAVKWALENKEEPWDVFVGLLPSQPLRKVGEIDIAIDFWLNHQESEVGGACNPADICIFKTDSKAGLSHPVIFEKSNQYWFGGGNIGVCHIKQYMDNNFNAEGIPYQYGQIPNYTVRLFPQEHWQLGDLDYPHQWEEAEGYMEKYILKGNPNVYKEYRTKMLSEYGFQQFAASYNKGVSVNLLPMEYRNSHFNHLPVYLECMKTPEDILGWELVEKKQDKKGHVERRVMKSIKARNGTDIFDEANTLKEPKPALIIGSGPSLDHALPLLKDWKGATFCSTSHGSTLCYFNAEPTHMIAYDIQSHPRELEWADTWAGRKTLMVTHPGMAPILLEAWPGKKIYFKSMDSANFYFTNVLPVAYGDVIPSYMFLFSCSVAAQMSLAHAMGYSPLFFVGCDFQDARFHKWRYDHDKKEWISDPDVYQRPMNYLTSANGQVTNSLQVFYKRSVLCVNRIDRSRCVMTSPNSIITEMPNIPIEEVIAQQGEGFEGRLYTPEQIADQTEKYLARFNSFILQFKPGENGKASFRVLESHAGDNWKADIMRYLTAMDADMKQHNIGASFDITGNVARFEQLKQWNAEEDAKNATNLNIGK